MSFFTEALPYAKQAHSETGVLTSVILAQWADETGYRWPAPQNNPGNVGTYGTQVTSYPSVEAGVNGYIKTMLLPYYDGVRGVSGWQAQCLRLGESPWAGGHYQASGGPPGEDLVKIIQADNLTQYDAVQPLPPQPPIPSRKDDQMLLAQGPNGTVLFVYGGSVSVLNEASDETALLGAGVPKAIVSQNLFDELYAKVTA